MNKQSEMCSFWMMEKKNCIVCVCVFMLSPILWWHMSCPMLWVLPLSCNNTPQCCLKYSFPGKPITLSQSHGFLIINPPSALVPQVTIFHLLHPTHLSASGCTSHNHPVLRLELKMPLSHSLLNFSFPLVHIFFLFFSLVQTGLVGFFEIQNTCLYLTGKQFYLKRKGRSVRTQVYFMFLKRYFQGRLLSSNGMLFK